DVVKISSFGSFAVRQKGQRVGRNPKTGQEVPISPRRVLVFRASHTLKHLINGAQSRFASASAPAVDAGAACPVKAASASGERSRPTGAGSAAEKRRRVSHDRGGCRRTRPSGACAA